MLAARAGAAAMQGARRSRLAPAPALAAYVTGFATTTSYAAGAVAAMLGSGGHTFFVAFIPRANTQNGALMTKANNASITTGGWSFRKTIGGVCEFRARDGASTKIAPTYTLDASDIGKIVMLHGVIDITANSVIRMYRQGVEIGSGTATSGSFTSSANDLGIGSRNGGAESIGSDCDIVGGGGTDAVMSSGDIAAHFAACVDANNVALPAPGTTKRVWRAQDFATPWADFVAASTLNVVGTLTTGSLTPSQWAT